jgi:hypothetical protein
VRSDYHGATYLLFRITSSVYGVDQSVTGVWMWWFWYGSVPRGQRDVKEVGRREEAFH